MMLDMFDKRSNKEKLLEFIRSRNYTKTSDVIRWGSDHFSNRADRDARTLCADGLIERMPEETKNTIFGPIKEDVWTPKRS